MEDIKFIPLSVPNLKGKEKEYVMNAVESEWVSTAGPYVTDFEKRVAEYVHTPAAVACQSGTAGIHVALQLCGVKSGDLVIAPTLTFIASVNPIKYIGAEPVFMDCDDSLCMDVEKLRSFCKEECEVKDGTLYHKATGKRIPAVVVVHVFGNMADMEGIMDVAKEYCLKVVEDACEAIGTYYTEGRYAGLYAGTIGDVGVYSFNGNKIITTGGGGMIVSMDEELLREAKHLTTQAKSDEANFYHDEIGFNYRLTNLQAALDFFCRAVHRRCVAFLMTDFQDSDYEKSLRLAARRHDMIAVEISDLRESVLQDAGLIEVQDAETGECCLLDTSSREVRDAYGRLAFERRQHLEQELRRSGVDFLQVMTDEDYERQLVSFFHRREARH